ncbi:MAG: D-glycero-beta-D-manno-heptose-7-phosphate kinase [Thermodesulfobacteria bacterium]|nr:D-glycero-beta-D-manno-heptose-7-phosphate kinase [Thermodesulfobacteriota bacterium]
MEFVKPEVLEKIEGNISNIKLIVIGDCILDRYFFGEVNRISPEAPVPVFDLKVIQYRLGGAANVAANLRGLGVDVDLVGVVGEDDKGRVLKALAEKQNIGISGIITDATRPTIIKTRLIAQAQQLLRIDREEKKPLDNSAKSCLKEVYLKLLERANGVIVSDYAKGVFLEDEFCNWLITQAIKREKKVFVDPKTPKWKKYTGATVITPNLKEFKEVLAIEGLEDKDFDSASEVLVKKYGLEFLVITLGKEGIYLFHPEEGSVKLPAYAKEVYDVSGAGDTVIASLSAFYLTGISLKEAVELANVSAGIVVGKVGTQPVFWREVKEFIMEKFK